MNTVHIVGLDHFLQNIKQICWTEDGKNEEQRQKAALAALLRDIIKKNDIELIAEEGKLDSSCLGSVLAKEANITHIDITMPPAEREKQGVKTPGYDKNENTRKEACKVFERYMCDRVNAENKSRILVMVGRRHLKGLDALLVATGCNTMTYDINDCGWYAGIPQEGAEGISGYYREA